MSFQLKNKLLLLVALVSLGFFAKAQLCGGSFGDPVFKEDFGSVSSSQTIVSGPLQLPATTSYTYSSRFPPNDGEYTITNKVTSVNGWAWVTMEDNTAEADGAYGNMLVVNASHNPGEFYRRRVSSLCPNQVYRFSAWVLNLIQPGFNQIKPNVTMRILSSSGAILGEVSTGDIAEDQEWKNYYIDFRSTVGSGEVDVVLINNAAGGIGNDIAIDDITFSPCGARVSFTANAPVFTGVCDNLSSFEMTADVPLGTFTDVRYIWQKSSDNGKTWQDLSAAPTTNPKLLVASETYKNGDQFRYVVAEQSNILSSNCRIASDASMIQIFGYPKAPEYKEYNFCLGSSDVLQSGTNIKWYTSKTSNDGSMTAPHVDTSKLGLYRYWISQTLNACESERTEVHVNVGSVPPKPNVSNMVVCQSQVAPALTADGINLRWYTQEFGGSLYMQTPIVDTSKPGTFSYWVSQNTFCEGLRSEVKVTVLSAPTPTTSLVASICDGDEVTLDAGDGYSSYEWLLNTPVFSRFLPVTEKGIYKVKVTTANGCVGVFEFEVKSGVTPEIIKITSDDAFLEVSASGGTPPYQYSLDGKNWQDSPRFTALKSGKYQVFVKSQMNSCVAIEEAVVISIPKFITPNQDGINDVFSIPYIDQYPDAKMIISDRHGRTIFSSTKENSMIWDGSYQRRAVATGTYWYHLSFGNGSERSGWLFVKNRN